MRKKVLFICGSVNQTSMMAPDIGAFYRVRLFFHSILYRGFSRCFHEKIFGFLHSRGKYKELTLEYLRSNDLAIDYMGAANQYNFVFTCSDVMIQKNIRNKKIFLVQEGMTDPQRLPYYLVKMLRFPRWIAGTSVTGMSNAYDLFFTASEGFKDLFIKKGACPEKNRCYGHT